MPPTSIAFALSVTGLRGSTARPDEPILAVAVELRQDVVVVSYPAAQRDRAWNVLRGSRELRGVPVVVVTDDAEQAGVFRDHLARMGIAVLVDPDDAALVNAVRHRAAS